MRSLTSVMHGVDGQELGGAVGGSQEGSSNNKGLKNSGYKIYKYTAKQSALVNLFGSGLVCHVYPSFQGLFLLFF